MANTSIIHKTSQELIISADEITQAQNLIVQTLRDFEYEGTFDKGTGLYDVVIKPLSLLLTLFKKEVGKTKAYLSLQNAALLKDELENEYDGAVDALLSNWFMSRKLGVHSTVEVELWFSRPLTQYTIQKGDVLCILGSKSSLYAPHSMFFTKENFRSVINPLNSSTEYGITLELHSNVKEILQEEVGSTLINTQISNGYFIRCVLLNILNPGEDIETSEEFIDRTKMAATTRELISDRALHTVIPQEFKEVRKVYVAGFGDAEQFRDVKEFESITVHVGNKADVYVETSPTIIARNYVVTDGKIILEGEVVLYIVSVGAWDTDKTVFTPTTYTAESSNELFYGNKENQVTLSVPNASEGMTLAVEFIEANVVSDIEEFITNPDNVVTCYDPRIKEKTPIMIYGALTVLVDYKDELDIDKEKTIAEVQKFAVQYVLSCNTTEGFSRSKLIAEIHDNIQEVVNVEYGISLGATYVNPIDFSVIKDSVGSLYKIDEVPETMSRQFTKNTTQFFSHTRMWRVTLEEVGV